MTIKICSNIARHRKDKGVTQLELAEYLGVSPQAVSKWEQELSLPDIYLIPKIAFFFDITIDALFGTTDLDTADLLVSKYSVLRNEKSYKEAREAVDTLLEMNAESSESQALLCRLENERMIEFLHKSKEACEKLQQLTRANNHAMEKRASIQLMRTKAMLGEYDFVEEYSHKFDESKTADNLNNLILATIHGKQRQYEEALRLGTTHLDLFSREEQRKISPNLMDIAYLQGNLEYVKYCFELIMEDQTNVPQIFNAWWLLWKTYSELGYQEEAEDCKIELLSQLPQQNCNEYTFIQLKNHIEGVGPKSNAVL